MTETSPSDLEDEITRLAAESLAVRMVLVHVLARLSGGADAKTASAIRRGFAGAERALKERAATDSGALTPAGLSTALATVESLKSAALGRFETAQRRADETPGALHGTENDLWPEDDY